MLKKGKLTTIIKAERNFVLRKKTFHNEKRVLLLFTFYDAESELSNEVCNELVWRKRNIKNSFEDLVIPTSGITKFIYASEID